jgi:hypothetical protein
MLLSFLLTTLLTLTSTSLANPGLNPYTQLAKPIINPPTPDLSTHLPGFLRGPTHQITLWDNDKINAHCKKVFAQEGHNVSDVQMFHVTYSDVRISPFHPSPSLSTPYLPSPLKLITT